MPLADKKYDFDPAENKAVSLNRIAAMSVLCLKISRPCRISTQLPLLVGQFLDHKLPKLSRGNICERTRSILA